MSELDTVLEECLERIARGEMTAAQCLEAYPQHAQELRRLLSARQALQRGGDLEFDHRAKARGRARLSQHMRAHPRRRSSLLSRLFPRPLRTAGALAGLLLAFLITGTAWAQTAAPGDLLYDWKLASEQALLAVTPDKGAAQRLLLERRSEELLAAEAPAELLAAVARYREAVTQARAPASGLEPSELDSILAEHRAKFRSAGLEVDMLELDPSRPVAPTATPSIEATVAPPGSAEPNPLGTLEASPSLVPTVEVEFD